MQPFQTFEDRRDDVLRLVKELGASFTDPSDDWMPTAFLRDGDDRLIVVALVIDKLQIADVTHDLVRQTNGKFLALVLSSWVVNADDLAPGEKASGIMPSQHPKRREALFVPVSDGRKAEMWIAMIKRSTDHPPTLDAWMKVDGAEGRMAAVALDAFTHGPLQ